MPRIVVSDHAMVRYMERVCGVNLDHIRKEIIKTVEIPARVGATRYSKDGITYALGKSDHSADEVIVATVMVK